MALLFGDSFDHYYTADILRKWTNASNVSASAGIQLSTVLPPHQRALALLPSNNADSYWEKLWGSTPETFVFGVWIRFAGVTLAAQVLTFHDNGGTEHVSLRTDTSGHFTFTRAGTVLATSTNTLSANTWYHIEGKVTIGDAADSPSGAYEVRVNGSSTGWIEAVASGADTRNGGNKSITSVRFHSRAVNSSFTYANDFYLLDTSGSVANDFLGPCRFAVLYPAGAGSSAEWAGNYADNFVNLREADGDSTFNQSGTASQLDLFNMMDVESGTIHAIQHVILARQDAGAQRSVRPKTRISSTNYDGSTVNTGPDYVYVLEPRSVSPATSAQWTASEINGAEFGYELVS